MEYGLEFFATIGHIMTGIGTITLAILLYGTFKHMNAATRATEIQTEYKFRPLVGPTGVIRKISSDEEKTRIEITIKNFGDLPATNVSVYSISKLTQVSKEEVRSSNKIDLGPVLPNMEKHYWFDIDNIIIDGAKKANGKISSGLLFEYPLAFGKSEYGMISEINPENFGFVHKDMWVFSPPMSLD